MNKARFVKTAALILTVFLACLPVFAFNPIINGDGFYEITSPELLAGASSVAGGALHEANSSSIVLNPSLIAGNQRWAFDLDYTSIFASNAGDSYAQACQFGLIIPSAYGVGAFLFQGIFADNVPTMKYGNSITFRGAYAKDLTSRLYVGIGLYGGWKYETDYAVACDIGFWYDLQKVWFMKNARWGMSLTGLGKSYYSDGEGFYYGNLKASELPSPFTLRVGYAADLINIKNFDWGFSVDASFPSFQNGVFDFGMQFLICNVIKISTGWEINSREVACGGPISMPVAGLSFNFNFTSTKNNDSFLAKQGWRQSEGKISTAYRNLPNGSHAVSAGFTAIMGQHDNIAPEIIMWEEDR